MLYKNISIYLISMSFFILGLFLGLSSSPVEKIDNFIVDGKIIETIKNRDKLPFGYRMETNGKEFAYVTSDGHRTLFPEDSLEEAIRSAWSYYDYENKTKKESWKAFEIEQDKKP